MPFRQIEMADLHRFAPGLDRAAMAEAMEHAHEHLRYLDWEAGDIVLVDNTRVMHAREPFHDGNRTLWVVTTKATGGVWTVPDVA